MTLGWDYGLKLGKQKEKKAKLDRAGKNSLATGEQRPRLASYTCAPGGRSCCNLYLMFKGHPPYTWHLRTR